ncbi:MAG: 2-phospho-L-lactate/phosphoenolpyruvate guanylyltransferase [Candidatus Binatota bacterium]|nr:2-phospho-L-lactate/phosphoenolpyruvate guanylyltransferase [Candidatus Binatota bacterium]
MRFALLPTKPLALAKTRLAPHLTDVDRRSVALAMFHDVLECLIEAPSVDVVAVVTCDPMLIGLADSRGTFVVDERAPQGLNGAAALGTRACLGRGATSVLIVLSDLPRISVDEVEALYAELPAGPHVRLVRSHEGLGTNALFRRPPEVVPTRFGGRSFQGHLDAASAAGTSVDVLDLPGIGFDVDTVADLQALTHTFRPSRTLAAAQRICLTPAGPI